MKSSFFSHIATPWSAGKSSSWDLISVFHSQKNGQCSCDWVYQKNLCNWRGKKDTQHQTNFLASRSNHFHFLHQSDLNQIQWVNLHPVKIKEILMRRFNSHLNDHQPKKKDHIGILLPKLFWPIVRKNCARSFWMSLTSKGLSLLSLDDFSQDFPNSK